MSLAHELAEALAEDAEALAALHDRELKAETLAALREVGFPANLGLLPAGEPSLEVWRLMAAALAETHAADLDLLAADYAAIYLAGAYGASPCESVWLDDDHLACQAPMFELRRLYAEAGLAAADWRKRPDDHLVLQLLYIAHALRRATGADDIRRLAAMLDEHLLRWLPDFSSRIAMRCDTAFYAGLVVLTSAWCEEFRDLLADRLGEPRPSREEVELRMKPMVAPQAVPVAFMPGVGPTI